MIKTITLLFAIAQLLPGMTIAQQTNTALDFDGVNDQVRIPYSSEFDFGSEFSFEALIFPTKTNYSRIVSNYSGGGLGNGEFVFDTFSSFPANGRGLRLSIIIDGVIYTASASNILILNKWQHVAGIYNSGTISVFVNGVQVAVASSGSSISKPDSINGISIGEDWIQGSAAEFFKGKIDEVRIWNFALSQSDIQDRMTTPLNGDESGLIAYYNFEEGIPNGNNSATGGDISQVLDQAGSNNGSVNNFTRNGTSSNWVNGKTFSTGNTALDFDGNNDFIEASGFPFLSTFTLEAWVNPDLSEQEGYKPVISRGGVFTNNTNYSFGFRYRAISADYRLFFMIYNGGTIANTEIVIPSPNNTWNHMAVSFDATTNQYTVYWNGEVAGQNTFPVSPTNGNQPLRIGAPSSIGGQNLPYNGKADEVRIWNRTLTQAEIQCGLNSPLTGSETGLVAYYDFEEGVELGDNSSLTKVFDKAGGNDGTLNGFTKTGIASNWVVGADALQAGTSNRWLGGSTDWDTASNWSYNAVPTECDNVLIPDVPNQPVIGSATTAVAGSLRLDTNTQLSIDGVLQVSNSITNDGSIIFKSTVSGSGQLDVFGGTITGSGTVTSERFMSANRAFRFVTSPVGGGQTIREAWQEGASTGDLNPNPGFGTHITGEQGSVGNVNPTSGLDETPTGNASLFTFNNVAQFYEPVTSTNITLQAGTAYALFKRGDRSANLLDNLADGETTLRATGALLIGPKSSGTDFPALSTAVQGFSLVPNPYQAKVDFNALSFSGGVNPNFLYVFDPSAPNFGDFVVLENPTDASDMFIHPGQSFFVVNDTDPLNISTPAITFNEDDKATGATPTTTVFSELARANLKLYNANNQRLDMVKFRFEENASNGADNFDALKMFNTGENVGTLINNQVYEIERRPIPGQNEIIPLYTDNYQGTVYEFTLVTENWNSSIDVFIQDNYLNTFTPIDDLQPYGFTVDANIPQSIASDRFSLVFDNTTLSLEDNVFGENFKLYPNPTSDGLFSISSSTLTGEVQIEIRDVLGKKVWSQTQDIIGNELRIDAQELNNGVYLISLSQGEKSHTTKLIIN